MSNEPVPGLLGMYVSMFSSTCSSGWCPSHCGLGMPMIGKSEDVRSGLPDEIYELLKSAINTEWQKVSQRKLTAASTSGVVVLNVL